MRARSTFLLFIPILMIQSCPMVFSVTPHKSDKSLCDLRSWDIVENAFYMHRARKRFSTLLTILLRRPGASNVSAIVKVKDDGTPSLNPDGFRYGPIPKLREITSVQAEQLWSPKPAAHPPHEGVRTFELESSSRHRIKIDLLFKQDRVQKFRIRAGEYSQVLFTAPIKEEWYDVQ